MAGFKVFHREFQKPQKPQTEDHIGLDLKAFGVSQCHSLSLSLVLRVESISMFVPHVPSLVSAFLLMEAVEPGRTLVLLGCVRLREMTAGEGRQLVGNAPRRQLAISHSFSLACGSHVSLQEIFIYSPHTWENEVTHREGWGYCVLPPN
jgi:hypothetical protein